MPFFIFVGHIITSFFKKSGNWRQLCKQTRSTFYTFFIFDARLQNNVLRTTFIRTLQQRRFFINLSRFTYPQLKKIKNIDKKFSTANLKKYRILIHQQLRQVKMYFFLLLLQHLFPLDYAFRCSIVLI